MIECDKQTWLKVLTSFSPAQFLLTKTFIDEQHNLFERHLYKKKVYCLNLECQSLNSMQIVIHEYDVFLINGFDF